jgi:hypothetical protein
MQDVSRWRLIDEILVASWQLPESEREACWIERAAGDQTIVDELRALSAARAAADRWAPEPAPEHPRGALGRTYLTG